MKKLIQAAALAVAFLALVIGAHYLLLAPYLLGSAMGTAVAPDRPEAVPASAVWKGGIDGGAFYLCEETADETVTCRVFNDYTGDLWALLTYRLADLQTQITPWSLEGFLEEISSFDGNRIYLMGSRALTSIEAR